MKRDTLSKRLSWKLPLTQTQILGNFDKGLIDAIEETARDVLERETPIVVSHLRIVPRLD